MPQEDLLSLFSSLLYRYTDFEGEPDPNRLRWSPAAGAEAGTESEEWSINPAKAVEEIDLLLSALISIFRDHTAVALLPHHCDEPRVHPGWPFGLWEQIAMPVAHSPHESTPLVLAG